MTDKEKQDIIDAVLLQIQNNSQSVDTLQLADSLNGVSSLPCVKGEELVSVPLSLFEKIVSDTAASSASGAIIEETNARISADANLQAQITETKDGNAELLKRIKGTSTASSAYTDPFKYIGNFASEKDESGTVTKHAIRVMQDALLDTLRHSDYSESFPYIGHMRAHIEGVPIEMWTYVKAWNTGSTNGVFVQVVRTNFGLKGGVISSALTSEFHEYHREVTVSMADGSVTDVTATVWNEITADIRDMADEGISKADAALSQIHEERQERAAQDRVLSEAVSQERTERTAADAELQAKISETRENTAAYLNQLKEKVDANTTRISAVEYKNTEQDSHINAAQETANSASEKATAASTAAQEAKATAETAQTAAKNEATARTEADTELQSQINGKQDNIDSLSKDEKSAFLVSLGLGKMGIVSQTQEWNKVGVEPAYVMSQKIEGLISKDNIDSLISYGFAFNEGTGYFELNGLTDISLQEALNIVAAGKPNFSLCDLHYKSKNIRTNLPIFDNVNYDVYFGNGISNPIRLCSVALQSGIEVFVYVPHRIDNNYNYTGLGYSTVSDGRFAFAYCNNLEKIYIIPGTTLSLYEAFVGCIRLKELELVYLGCDVNLSSSAYLSAKSTHIMIVNAKNNKTITITLHPDAKARWEASEYYEEDSQTIISKNITIA